MCLRRHRPCRSGRPPHGRDNTHGLGTCSLGIGSHSRVGRTGQAGPHALALHRRHRGGVPRHRRRVRRPRVRGEPQVARHRLRRADQDAHRPVIFCTIVLGDRRDQEGGQRRPDRRAGPRLLPDHVHGGAGHRPGRRQHPAPRRGPAALRRTQGPGRRPRVGGRGRRRHRRLPHRPHPDDVVLRADRGLGAPGAAGRPPRRVRHPVAGPLGRADPARCRLSAEAGLPRPRHGHVAGAHRRLRGHRGGRRRDRPGRTQEPGRAHARLLRHLRDLRLRHPRPDPPVRRPSTSSRCCGTSAASSC